MTCATCWLNSAQASALTSSRSATSQRQARRGIFAWIVDALMAAGLTTAVSALRHGSEVERATDTMIAEAQRQIGLQYETADAQDIKTLGMVAASIAAAAFVANAQHHWRAVLSIPVWVVPLTFLAASIIAFLMSLWQQRFQRGPNVPRMYRTFGGTMIEMKGQLLRELVEAIEHNRALLPPKSRWYAGGCWGLLLSAASAVIAVAVS